MDAFWARGFEATSMADLCHRTGLHKGSLYQAFGDKKALFMDALRHYADTEFKKTVAVAFDSKSPLDNLRGVINQICNDVNDEKGCMMVNSMVELAPHDPEVREFLLAVGAKRARFLTELLEKAQQAGEIRSALTPERLARQLMMTMAGGAAMVKSFVTADDVRATLNEMIDSWV